MYKMPVLSICGLTRCQRKAEENGGRCLSTEYVNAKSKLLWQCSENHKWEATPDSVVNGNSWCKKCSDIKNGEKCRLKDGLEKCQMKAEERGGRCLSTEYVNATTKMKWECSQGHIWEAISSSVINNNRWCKICADIKNGEKCRLNNGLEKCQKRAEENGGRCLSTEYLGAHKKLEWKCSEGHTWEATASSVINGNKWCKKCSDKRVAKANTLKDGLAKCQKVAEDKGGRCLSTEYLGAKIKLEWECHKQHTWDAIPDNVVRGISWCPKCAYERIGESLRLKDGLEKCQKIAEANGGRCLSTEYITNDTKLKWECSQGHIWETTPLIVINSNGWCKKCSDKKMAEDRILTNGLERCQNVAKSRDGKCLSTEYLGAKIKLEWECHKQHTWRATPDTIINNDTWCPHCTNSVSKISTQWLDSLPDSEDIIKEYHIPDTRYHADGYNPKTNTVYEFNGCYWHGCINCYWGDDIRERYILSDMTYDDLFDRTIDRECIITDLGYNYVSIWECQFKSSLS